MLTLYIGNKNYSSWSMRPWVLLKQAGIAFDEVMIRFDSFEPGSGFRQGVEALGATGKVPVLHDSDVGTTGLQVYDTLAIAEYLAEKFPALKLWPADVRARAQGRSACAEMHSGFAALRSACPMNIEASLPEVGQLVWRDKPAVRADVARICKLWGGLLAEHGEPMLLGDFSIADAYFAPVVMRLKTYALPVPADISAYMARVQALPGVKAWMDEALAEKDFRDFEEPYRMARQP
jgi:glutathione S-transferase